MDTEKITVVINGEERIVTVKKHALFNERKNAAVAVINTVVGDNGKYIPWAKDILEALSVIALYTDLELPESWDDNEVDIFWRENGGTIEQYIDAEELCSFNYWVCDGVEAKKEYVLGNPMREFKELLSAFSESFKLTAEEEAGNTAQKKEDE